jgi:YD repeat-containing protein
VAIIARSGGNDTFGYDNIGNMTSRVEGGTSYTQTFNAEVRLASVAVYGSTWTFTYDGDGNCIKQANPDGTTTLYLGGGAYEGYIDGQTSTVTKYYAIAGQRVMRDSSGLHYLLSDHLGSFVAILDDNGDLESDERYLPFGGSRDSTGISQTGFAFTGQRNLGF